MATFLIFMILGVKRSWSIGNHGNGGWRILWFLTIPGVNFVKVVCPWCLSQNVCYFQRFRQNVQMANSFFMFLQRYNQIIFAGEFPRLNCGSQKPVSIRGSVRHLIYFIGCVMCNVVKVTPVRTTLSFNELPNITSGTRSVSSHFSSINLYGVEYFKILDSALSHHFRKPYMAFYTTVNDV